MSKKKEQMEEDRIKRQQQLNDLNDKSIEELKQEAEKQRLINDITSGSGSPDRILAAKLHSMKTWSIITIILCFFLIGFILELIFGIIFGIQILTTDWKNKEVNDSKTIWGILCFILLGVISSLIFALKYEKLYA